LLKIANNYLNPFSEHFKHSVEKYHQLSVVKKVAAVAAGVFGALVTPFLLCSGGFALFQLTVRVLMPTAIRGGSDRPTVKVSEGLVQVSNKVGTAELLRLLNMPSDDWQQWAERKGYTRVTNENLIQGYTGKGYLICRIGERYLGDFVNGVFSGTGTHIYLNQFYRYSVYHGSYVEGKRSGFGCLLFGEFEGWYEGEFAEGRLSGTGTLYDGRRRVTIAGQFLRDYVHGRAEASFENGDLYSGDFHWGKMQDGSMVRGNIQGYQSKVYRSPQCREQIPLDDAVHALLS